MAKNLVARASGDGREWFPEEAFGAAEKNALEVSLGAQLDYASWEELKHDLMFYAVFGRDELGAASIEDTANRLDAVVKAGIVLQTEIRNADVGATGHAMSYVVNDIWEERFNGNWLREQHWDVIRADIAAELAALGHPDPEARADTIVFGWRGRQYLHHRGHLEGFDTALHELMMATSLAKGSFARGDQDKAQRGDAWRDMVLRLTIWAKQHRYPTEARTDTDKMSDDNQHSPFTKFVEALQGLMPTEYRRHTSSRGALASAINRARRGSKAWSVQKYGSNAQ